MKSEFTMDCDFIRYPEAGGLIPCAVRIRAPVNVERSSAHLILLLDISESMCENNKLEHVKQCCQVIVDLLTPQDHLSLITFGDSSKILLNRVSVDTAQKEHIRAVVQGLRTDGCTNLSAGLLNVSDVLRQDTTHQKAGLLLLTDGIANAGIKSADGLLRILSGMRTEFSHMSVHCVGYGIDHNAELLQGLAEETNGSYNIVQNIEDTATAFGDTLGGLMSIAAQNVTLIAPHGTIIHGPYKNEERENTTHIAVGDIYAGTSPILLFDCLPEDFVTVSVKLTGFLCDGTQFEKEARWTEQETREPEVELCRLRYACTDILQSLREWRTLSVSAKAAMEARIDLFETQVGAEALASYPVTANLRTEGKLMRELLRQIRYEGNISQEDRTLLSQHSAVMGLGRGFTSPIRYTRYTEELDDPTNTFQNVTQTSTISLLRAATRNISLPRQ
jgi:Mg-chelatase subunit ChlD